MKFRRRSLLPISCALAANVLMTNKKKQKQKAVQHKAASAEEDANLRTQDPSAESAAPPDGTYARYKRSTNLVHEWCDAIVGTSTKTLHDWSVAMDALAERGQSMPAAVRASLDLAIELREKANAFYRAIQAADEQQHRQHWHVCRLLRQFRRLFSPRKSAVPPPSDALEAEPASSMGFEALEIEATPTDDEDEEAAINVANVSEETNASSQEDDELFALACLLADAAETREEVRHAWADWAPAADHCASLLGSVCAANFAVARLERIVNATQLTLGLPDANLATIAAIAPPRARLLGLQSRPELNGRCGLLGPRESGRYAVTVDGTDDGSPPILARPDNLCGEHGWEVRPEAMLGILQQVGRSLADFDHEYMPPIARIEIDVEGRDHTRQLGMYVRGGALWQWTNYAQGIGRYGNSETMWRRQMRAFVAQREAEKGSRDVSFIVAFLIAMAVETTVDRLLAGVDVRPVTIGPVVMRELKFYLVHNRVALAAAPLSDRTVAHEVQTNLTALEMVLESEPTVQSNLWLAGDVLECANRMALTSKVVWGHKAYVIVMVHIYHAMRYWGHLRAVAEVDALLRMFRRSIFFRTDQLPHRGAFGKALSLAIGATASSVSKGAPEMKHGRIVDYVGINGSETSLLRYVSTFGGAEIDVSKLDFQAIAREEVDVLHRAPTLAGVSKLLRVRDVMLASGLKESTVINAVDNGALDALEKAVSCWEQVFPGCGCVPPAPEAAVPLVFSSYSHVEPAKGLKGAHSSSYVPASERLTREQLKQKYRDGIAAAREGTIRIETW